MKQVERVQVKLMSTPGMPHSPEDSVPRVGNDDAVTEGPEQLRDCTAAPIRRRPLGFACLHAEGAGRRTSGKETRLGYSRVPASIGNGVPEKGD